MGTRRAPKNTEKHMGTWSQTEFITINITNVCFLIILPPFSLFFLKVVSRWLALESASGLIVADVHAVVSWFIPGDKDAPGES